MFFVMKIVPTSRGHIESNLRMGGYKHQDTAFAAAKREGPCLVRDHTRAIVGQTINKDIPGYIQ